MKTLHGHIYDVYNQALRAMRHNSPQLLSPLKKALHLCLADHVVINKPRLEDGDPRICIAGVYSQNGRYPHQYRIVFNVDTRIYTCTCPSFELEQYLSDGRVYCKHVLATQIMLRAHHRLARQTPDTIVGTNVRAFYAMIARPTMEANA